MSQIIDVTENNYQEFVSQDAAVLVAGVDWCAPCRGYKSILDDVSADFPDVPFGYIDLEKRSSSVKKDVRIEGIPVTIVFSKGQVKGTFEGMRLRQTATSMIEDILAKN